MGRRGVYDGVIQRAYEDEVLSFMMLPQDGRQIGYMAPDLMDEFIDQAVRRIRQERARGVNAAANLVFLVQLHPGGIGV